MKAEHYIKKGDRVKARWFLAQKIGTHSLAGCQVKVNASAQEVVGRVTHVYGDHPTQPKNIEIWVLLDAGGSEVKIQPDWIVEVLGS